MILNRFHSIFQHIVWQMISKLLGRHNVRPLKWSWYFWGLNWVGQLSFFLLTSLFQFPPPISLFLKFLISFHVRSLFLACCSSLSTPQSYCPSSLITDEDCLFHFLIFDSQTTLPIGCFMLSDYYNWEHSKVLDSIPGFSIGDPKSTTIFVCPNSFINL